MHPRAWDDQLPAAPSGIMQLHWPSPADTGPSIRVPEYKLMWGRDQLIFMFVAKIAICSLRFCFKTMYLSLSSTPQQLLFSSFIRGIQYAALVTSLFFLTQMLYLREASPENCWLHMHSLSWKKSMEYIRLQLFNYQFIMKGSLCGKKIISWRLNLCRVSKAWKKISILWQWVSLHSQCRTENSSFAITP